VQAKKIAEQDKQDIDRIVPACVQLIRHDYPESEDGLLKIYPDKGGLEAILKWHFLLNMPLWIGNDIRPGETYLSYQREHTKTKLNEEVAQERQANSGLPVSTLLARIESRHWCFIADTQRYTEAVQKSLQKYMSQSSAGGVMNGVARLIYYYELKDSLLRSEE